MIPKISIIIPTYNRENVVSHTLDSVINQTFQEWECIVVDDNSVDSTYQLLLEYAQRDTRFKILKNEREKGACGARNTGLSYARSELIQFFDSDDEMYPDLLSELYNHISEDVDVVTCWTNVLDVDSGKIVETFENISEGNIHDALMIGKTYVDTNCALIRKRVVDVAGGWSEDCPSFQEWDFHLKLSKYAKYVTLRKHLISYNVGGADTISKSLARWLAGRLYILNKNKKEYLFRHPIAYLKLMLNVYNTIKCSKDETEKTKLIRMYVDGSDNLTRLTIKLLFIPYSLLKNDSK